MRIAVSLALLLMFASAAHTQTPATAVESPAPLAGEPVPQVTPMQQTEPAVVESAEVRVEREPLRQTAARQDEPSRALWFVVGALVAVALVLAVTL